MSAGIGSRGRRELTEVVSGRRFVTPDDAVEALGIDADAAAKKLARWADDGWLRRVRRGLYIGVPVDAPNPGTWAEDSLAIASVVWDPCYFTGWTAARHWGLTEQVFQTTVLKTSARVRSVRQRLLDHEYMVGHVSADSMSWGLSTAWSDTTRLRYANPARTVVEILDAPSLAGGIRHAAEVVEAYLDDFEPMDLIDVADRFGNGAVNKRLGYLVETLALEFPALVEACRARVSAGISALDPDGPASGRRLMRWGLRINGTVTPEGHS